ncbi:MAG: response regulator [Chloroflexota bacterium]
MKILMIDDSAAFRTAASMLLQFGGYDILQAGDGQSGIKLAQEQHPDLILCDMHMPGMNGDVVLEVLQASESTSSIRFVFLTGLGDTHVPEGFPFLSKPLKLESLQKLLDDLAIT